MERAPQLENPSSFWQETSPKYINLHFERKGDISEDREKLLEKAVVSAVMDMEEEWDVQVPIDISFLIMDDTSFREGATSGPMSWKYCFLLRDGKDNKIYCNAEVLNVLPDDADKMIKHELTHAVVGALVGNEETYERSFILEEGTAGFKGATERLITKIKKENITEIPDPLSLKAIGDIKVLGGDTNKEPFMDQLGYLTLFSFVEFLRKRNGEQKIIEVYKNLDDKISIEESYERVCGEKLDMVQNEWKAYISNQINVLN